MLDAGHLGQNICLMGATLDLKVVPIGGFYDDLLHDKNINLKNNELNYELYNNIKNCMKARMDNNNHEFQKLANYPYTKNCVTCIPSKKNNCTFCECVQV